MAYTTLYPLYVTKNANKAAWLMSFGHKLLGIHKDKDKTYYQFVKTDKLYYKAKGYKGEII